MKKLLLAYILIFSLASCTKQDVTQTTQTSTSADNSISYSFAPGYSGSTVSIVFSVSVKDPNITKVELWKSPTTFKDEADNTIITSYKLYDRQCDAYPTYEQSMYYYFILTNKDGSKSNTTPFQVY